MDDLVQVPRELIGQLLNILGNAASMWPDASGAQEIRRIQFELMAAIQSSSAEGSHDDPA